MTHGVQGLPHFGKTGWLDFSFRRLQGEVGDNTGNFSCFRLFYSASFPVTTCSHAIA